MFVQDVKVYVMMEPLVLWGVPGVMGKLLVLWGSP